MASGFNVKRALGTLALGILLFTGIPLHAHEFWMEPVAEPLAPGGSASLSLRVGEFFSGDLIGFSAAQTAGLRLFTVAGSKDLRALLPARTAVAAITLPLTTAGTHMVAYESRPSMISLSADRFHAYLHDEGLDFIKTQREAAGTAEKPGRERYRRFVKTLFRVGDASGSGDSATAAAPDMTYAARAGQRLEVVPLSDPSRLAPGNALGIRVFFEEKPLAGALLKAWYKRDGQTMIIRSTTAADGAASFNLPYSGVWMISVVHMVPAIGVKDIDWDSLWGNLTFVMPTPLQK